MVSRGQITWKVAPLVVNALQPIRQALGKGGYAESRRGLQDHLCGYFNADGNANCTREGGDSISPMGCAATTPTGWKCFKVRWRYPGCGSSGGLRLAVTVHCDHKRVNIVGMWMRKEKPTKADFKDKFEDPDPEPDE